MTIRRYTDLSAWQKAMSLVEEVYLITRGFPKEELYGLTSQLRRSAVSIPSNIAERFAARAAEAGRLIVGLMNSLEKHAAAS